MSDKEKLEMQDNIILNNCTECRVRHECANSDRELTCEEFKQFMEEQELSFFEAQIKEVDKNVQN